MDHIFFGSKCAHRAVLMLLVIILVFLKVMAMTHEASGLKTSPQTLPQLTSNDQSILVLEICKMDYMQDCTGRPLDSDSVSLIDNSFVNML